MGNSEFSVSEQLNCVENHDKWSAKILLIMAPALEKKTSVYFHQYVTLIIKLTVNNCYNIRGENCIIELILILMVSHGKKKRKKRKWNKNVAAAKKEV